MRMYFAVVVLLALCVIGCANTRTIEEWKRADGSQVRCIEPPPDVMAKGANVDLNVAYRSVEILKGKLDAEAKFERIRAETPNIQAVEVLDYRLCNLYGNGVIDAKTYQEYLNQILPLLRQKQTKASIQRAADYRQTQCERNERSVSHLEIHDVITIEEDTPYYRATAWEIAPARVQLVDATLGANHSAQPVAETQIHASMKVKIWNLVVKNRAARGRWIWDTSDPSTPWVVGFISNYSLHAIDAAYLLPGGAEITESRFEPQVAAENCVGLPGNQVQCRNLNLPPNTAVIHRWKSTISGCQAVATSSGAAAENTKAELTPGFSPN